MERAVPPLPTTNPIASRCPVRSRGSSSTTPRAVRGAPRPLRGRARRRPWSALLRRSPPASTSRRAAAGKRPRARRAVPGALPRGPPPSTAAGSSAISASGLIKGIGPAYAKQLVAAFGEDVFDVIERTPGVCAKSRASARRAPSASPPAGRTRRRSARSWSSCSRTASPPRAQCGSRRPTEPTRCRWSPPIPTAARDIRGIGFKIADQIAKKLGVSSTSAQRARAGLAWVLHEPPIRALRAAARTAARERRLAARHSTRCARTGARRRARDRRPRARHDRGEPCVFLRWLWEAERSIAERLDRLRRGEPPGARSTRRRRCRGPRRGSA